MLDRCTGTAQTFQSTASDATFDVNDSGYLRQTAWVSNADGLLVLDQNYNGLADRGTRAEMAEGSILMPPMSASTSL
ncbi:MAG: hypothetical protein ACK5TK_04875 [Betaproteobacteria bacterium]